MIDNPAIGSLTSSTSGVGFAAGIYRVGITLLLIAGVIAFLFVFFRGGFGWLTSAGNQGKIQSARSILTKALVGILIFLSAFFVLNVVSCNLGVNLYQFSIDELDVSFGGGIQECSFFGGILTGGGGSGGSGGGGGAGGGAGGGGSTSTPVPTGPVSTSTPTPTTFVASPCTGISISGLVTYNGGTNYPGNQLPRVQIVGRTGAPQNLVVTHGPVTVADGTSLPLRGEYCIGVADLTDATWTIRACGQGVAGQTTVNGQNPPIAGVPVPLVAATSCPF